MEKRNNIFGGIQVEEEVKAKALEELRGCHNKFKQIESMIDERDYCTDIVKKIRALQTSLDRISHVVLECHLHTCLKSAIRRGDEERIFDEILEILKYRS